MQAEIGIYERGFTYSLANTDLQDALEEANEILESEDFKSKWQSLCQENYRFRGEEPYVSQIKHNRTILWDFMNGVL